MPQPTHPAQRRGTADRLRWTLAADVCALVRRHPGITRARVAQELAISSGTAADLVTRMRQAAILDEGTPVPHGRGRPTSELTAHPEGPLIVAIDPPPGGPPPPPPSRPPPPAGGGRPPASTAA